MGNASPRVLRRGDEVTARTLANLLGVSEKAISELAKRGIIASAGPKRYALQASVSSYCAYLRAMARGSPAEDGLPLKDRAPRRGVAGSQST
jgi:phage terminase Nu1 subunit (DNA packaging protein)